MARLDQLKTEEVHLNGRKHVSDCEEKYMFFGWFIPGKSWKNP